MSEANDRRLENVDTVAGLSGILIDGAAEISAAYTQFYRTLATHCQDEISRSLGLWNGYAGSLLATWAAAAPTTEADHAGAKEGCCGDCTSKTCSRFDPFQDGIHGAHRETLIASDPVSLGRDPCSQSTV